MTDARPPATSSTAPVPAAPPVVDDSDLSATSSTAPVPAAPPVVDDSAVLVTRDPTDPAVAVLVLNRPQRFNALTVELKTALLAALGELGDCRAAVITGAGRAFCVGQDLGEHAAALQADRATAFDTVTEHYNRIVLAIAELPFPVVAAINGPCVGAGLGFAMACDLRIAAAGLKFSTAFTGIGLAADSGLSASLAHAVGVSRATELLMLNETFTAEDAAGWGLVRAVVPAAEVLPASLELARRLAAGPTMAYAEVKRAVRHGAVSDLPAVLAAEGAAQTRLAATEDHVNAVADFLAKRRPTFHGK